VSSFHINKQVRRPFSQLSSVYLCNDIFSRADLSGNDPIRDQRPSSVCPPSRVPRFPSIELSLHTTKRSKHIVVLRLLHYCWTLSLPDRSTHTFISLVSTLSTNNMVRTLTDFSVHRKAKAFQRPGLPKEDPAHVAAASECCAFPYWTYVGFYGGENPNSHHSHHQQ
jgi:hypothetical protein